MPRTLALIVAAGKGERAGATLPKQYAPLGTKTILARSVAAFAGMDVQLVIGEGQDGLCREVLGHSLTRTPVTGGATRQESVRRGLEALQSDPPDFVLIHDAARPLVSPALIARVIAALEAGADAAIPMLGVTDTLRRRETAGWSIVPRDGLLRAQTPQGFRFAAILRAHRDHAGEEATDDMALAERAGLKIETVAGAERNLKITKKEDFAMAEKLLPEETRTAMGYDAHRFVPGDHVWLCGVRLAHDHALEGHSDADAGLHALTDALLGTIGAGDIGEHFPPSDERWKGASSAKFLEHAAGLVAARGARIVHCDVTLVCERPKIGPHRQAMREKLAALLGIEEDRVSVKATTTDGMGFTGRREGLAAMALATVRLP